MSGFDTCATSPHTTYYLTGHSTAQVRVIASQTRPTETAR